MVEGGLVLSVGICGTSPRIFAAIAVGVAYVGGAAADATETKARQAVPMQTAPSATTWRGVTFLVEGVIGVEP